MDLVPCLGLCCCFLSFYTEIPDCFGTVCESSVCCVNNRTLLCKTGKEEDVYCRCLALECDVLGCKTCIKVSTAVVYPLSHYALAHTFLSASVTFSDMLFGSPHFVASERAGALPHHPRLHDGKRVLSNQDQSTSLTPHTYPNSAASSTRRPASAARTSARSARTWPRTSPRWSPSGSRRSTPPPSECE
jgi:hypothetical protein